MGKKIVIVQHGPPEEVFPLLSVIIGLQKAYPGSYVIWAGDPSTSDLVKYNKRIKRILDVTRDFSLKTLELVFGTDICVNASFNKIARQFTSNVNALETYGFTREGAISRSAEFFENVLSGKIITNKTLLQIYYDLVDLRWRGEGYGLTYYPRLKQSEKCGLFVRNSDIDVENCIKTRLPSGILKQLDTLNKFAKIITDDLFVTHAAIALRKYCTLLGERPFQMEFFGKGTVQSFIQ
ncbi:MAG: hypothetical protein ACXAC5_11700 [Promethearchaeota archaeon]|jgi:hypothetical protein